MAPGSPLQHDERTLCSVICRFQDLKLLSYKALMPGLYASCKAIRRHLQVRGETWFIKKEFLHDWTDEWKKDLTCSRCLRTIVGVLRWQNGPVHYGCLTAGKESLKNPGEQSLCLLQDERAFCQARAWVHMTDKEIEDYEAEHFP